MVTDPLVGELRPRIIRNVVDFPGAIQAEELVTGGLPVHIAARILGHKTLTTTQAYLTVFQDDLVRTYRSFLDRRRADHPAEEYREFTSREWEEFLAHFELRKVPLGVCGCEYGTPCALKRLCQVAPYFALTHFRSHD